jgi:hypothetical protein
MLETFDRVCLIDFGVAITLGSDGVVKLDNFRRVRGLPLLSIAADDAAHRTTWCCITQKPCEALVLHTQKP